MKKIKIPYMNVLPVLVIAFFLFKLVYNTELSIGGILRTIYGCIAYFVAGFVVAYLLNPAMVFFEKLISSKRDSAKMQRLKRAGVIAFLYLMLAGVVAIFVVAIIPTIRTGVQEIMDSIPLYTYHLQTWLINMTGETNSQLQGTVEAWIEDGFRVLYNWLQGMDLSSVSDAVTSGVSSFATGIIRFGFGLIISVYYLYSKERLTVSVKKLLYACLGKKHAESLMETGQKINAIFLDFIVSKLLQSLIMFIVGLIVLVPIRVPLAPLLALMMAIFNMIPYFGPFFGGVLSVLLVLFYSPIMALWVLIYAVGIQILDNAVIGPKIMSEQVGISPVLVIAGVTLGGTFGGILGMFLGVPVVAVIKLVFYDPYIERKLQEKDIIL